jgi:N-acetylmuramoyl-L-alanine amidase-like protein
LRVLEWRAQRLPDPVERLQFLRRQRTPGLHAPIKRTRTFGHLRAPAIALGLALACAALLRPRASSPAARPSLKSRTLSSDAPSPAKWVPASSVWLVEAAQHSDTYSNGLRVENQFLAATIPRKYLALARSRPGPDGGQWRSEPAGIVFHTTESHLAPFEEDQNRELRRAGEGLLEYVSRRRSYHFVIDRFGRVFRIVPETDYANHAGNSIWADDNWVYLNLNQSFFGVAFEAQSNPDGAELPANPAQIHAGRILVEMLRARYSIPAANCVAHAQVSVNPANGRAGYHIDWAANLPFLELGLSDNYSHPLPSVSLFGFEADTALLEAGGGPLARGIEAAQDKVQAQAAAENVPIVQYRRALQAQYREALDAQKLGASAQR